MEAIEYMVSYIIICMILTITVVTIKDLIKYNKFKDSENK